MWRKFYVCMDETDSGEGGGAGGGFAFAAAAGVGVDQGQSTAIPEKYQVKKEDGSLDVEASSLKLAEAYGHLEKRLGSGDMPPKSADEYQLNVPDAYKDVDLSSDSLLAQFKQDALAKGLTQDQFDFVMGKYFEIAPGLVTQSQQLSMDECTANLREAWKTDSQYNTEMRKAHMALVAFGEKDAQGLMNDYGNDPRLIRLLNRVGAEMGEDTSINPGGTTHGGQSVESLMSSEAYNNSKHPDHARVSAQVQNFFNQKAAVADKAGTARMF